MATVSKSAKKSTTAKTKTKAKTTPAKVSKSVKITEIDEMPKTSEPVPAAKKSRTWLYALLALVGVIVLLLIIFKQYIVVATVNGKPIFWYQYYQNMANQGGQQVLEQMVMESLLTQEATKQGVTVSPEELESAVKAVTDSLQSSNTTIEEALAQEGMTMADLQRRVYLNKVVTELATKEVTVSAEEVKDYMDKNKALLPPNMDKQTNLNQLVADQLLKSKQQEAIQGYLENLKKAALIQYF